MSADSGGPAPARKRKVYYKGAFERPKAIAAQAARDTEARAVGVFLTLDEHGFFFDETSARWLVAQLQDALIATLNFPRKKETP